MKSRFIESRPEKGRILIQHGFFSLQSAIVLATFAVLGCDLEARQARKELGHTTPAVRAAAVEKLSRAKGRSAIPEIGPHVNDRSPVVRLAVVKELRKLKSPKGLHYLQMAARDVDPEVRLSAVRGMGELKDERAVPTLLARFDDHNPVVRRATRYALKDIGIDRSEQVALLAERSRNRWISLAASNRAVSTRIEAIRALSLSGKTDVFSILLPMLEESDVEVVEAAAVGLGLLGGERALNAFESGMLDHSPLVKKAMEKGVVKMLNNHPPGDWTLDFLESDSAETKKSALAQLLRHFSLVEKPTHKEKTAEDKLTEQASKEGSGSTEEFFNELRENSAWIQKICALFNDPEFEIAYKAGLLARNLRLNCLQAVPENGIRHTWLKALIEGSITDTEEEKIAEWCKKHSLKTPLAELFSDLDLPKTHNAVKARAEELYKQYRHASERWLDEDQWRSLEDDERARKPGPKIKAPSDPKAERMTELLSRFPDRPGEAIVFFQPAIDSEEVKKVLRYSGLFAESKSFLSRIVLDGPEELHEAALIGLSARDFTKSPSLETVEAIKKAVTGSVETRKAAAKALGAMRNYGLSILLQLFTKDPDSNVRAASAEALARTGLTAAREPLRKSLQKQLSIPTIRALQKLQDPLSAPILLKHLKGNPPEALLEERASLIQALGTLGRPEQELVATLVEELDHPAWGIRMIAAESLGMLGAKKAVPALEARLTDFYGPVRKACRHALERLKTDLSNSTATNVSENR